MVVRFPQRRADGSFDMLIEIGMPPDLTVPALQTWLARWVERRAVWERLWESAGRTEPEVLRFTDDFLGPPESEPRDGGAVVRCRVRPQAKMWRDWGAQLYEDLQKDHEGVVLVGIKSAAD
jgi:hypothetical protein